MKIYLSGFFFLLSIVLPAQEETKAPFFFNEFSLSVNHAMPVAEDLEGRIGWGVGMHRVIWPHRNLNMVTGLVYNRINLYAEEMMTSRWHYRKGVETRFNYIQVPVLFRYGLGNKIRPFVEAGPTLAIGLPSRSTGTEVSVSPPGNGSSTSEFSERGSPRTYLGLTGGLGMAIQWREILLIPKINYQVHTDLLGEANGYNVHFIQFSLAAQW